MKNLFNRVIGDRRGVSALEYGLMAALIAGAMVTAVTTFGRDLSDMFTALSGVITTNTP